MESDLQMGEKFVDSASCGLEIGRIVVTGADDVESVSLKGACDSGGIAVANTQVDDNLPGREGLPGDIEVEQIGISIFDGPCDCRRAEVGS